VVGCMLARPGGEVVGEQGGPGVGARRGSVQAAKW